MTASQHRDETRPRYLTGALADEASRVLPDLIDPDQLEELSSKYGDSINDLISQMGGSP